MSNRTDDKFFLIKQTLLEIPSARLNTYNGVEIITYKQGGWIGEFFLDDNNYYVFGKLSREQTIDKCCEEIILLKRGEHPDFDKRIDN